MGLDDVAALAGRLLLALLFLAFAFGTITNFSGTVAYMDSHGVPMAPLFCAAAAVVEGLGGLSLMLGLQARWGAAVLVAFLVAQTWIFHASPDQRIHMLQNIAIIGGLLQIVAFGPGAMSLEGRRS